MKAMMRQTMQKGLVRFFKDSFFPKDCWSSQQPKQYDRHKHRHAEAREAVSLGGLRYGGLSTKGSSPSLAVM